MTRFQVASIVFLTGLATMIFEIVGSRVLGPYFGSSVVVWTGLIGVVFASLSVGYWVGGLISARRTEFTLLGMLLMLAAIFVFITCMRNIYILDGVLKYINGFRFRILVASVILFAPASFIFGIVLPYGVRLSIGKLSGAGRIVGNLYALSSLGSIVGTFLAGFILLPLIGHQMILFFLSLFLLMLSLWVISTQSRFVYILLPAFFTGLFILIWLYKGKPRKDLVDVDTRYNRVIIFDTKDAATGRPIKMLRINDENSSAMFTDNDNDLVFEVLKYYRLVDYFVPGFKNTLMIGGSGYAFPKDFLKRFPKATIDVVEIDPGLTRLAHQYFNLNENPNLNIIHEDGRTFLNRCDKKYDAVFMDAYKSMITIPYQLTTVEAVRKIYDALNDHGVVFANIISTMNSENNLFLRSEFDTYSQVFPRVYLYAVQYPEPTEEQKNWFQNFMLVGFKTAPVDSLKTELPEYKKYLSHRINTDNFKKADILTDEHAPVEFYAAKAYR